MTTERLYYDDAYLAFFTAQVTTRGEYDGRPAVVLNRSAFYPEGGGQPADRGLIGGIPVLDVQVRDGEVWHMLEAMPPDGELECRIDWARRFDHMQQHHGQHLLSAAFVATAGLATVSFHLGAEVATIDLDSAGLAPEQVAAAEDLANQVIWEDRPITARFVDAEELARLPLRKAPSVAGPVRVVSVADFDYSACGGTHPRSTGGVGLIVVRSWARQKGGVRIEFLCGGRALRDYRRANGVASRSAGLLSVGRDELGDALERIRGAHDQLRKEADELRERLLDSEAVALYEAAEERGALRLVCRVLEERSPEQLRALAGRIATRPGGVALLGSQAGGRASLVVACDSSVGLDARVLLRHGIERLGGRGGGTATLAQGGGPQVEALTGALRIMAESPALAPPSQP